MVCSDFPLACHSPQYRNGCCARPLPGRGAASAAATVAAQLAAMEKSRYLIAQRFMNAVSEGKLKHAPPILACWNRGPPDATIRATEKQRMKLIRIAAGGLLMV